MGFTSLALEHLVLLPQGGLGNRMRAIASARRLCQIAGARCSIVWDWPDYAALFEHDPTLDVSLTLSAALACGYSAMRTLPNGEGGSPETRRIPLDGPAGIFLDSCHCFGATSDAKAPDEGGVVTWLPRPSHAVQEKAAAFRAVAFPPGPIVGFHMRRTDHRAAAAISPDRLFFRAARSARREGEAIFLATDTPGTEARLRQYIGGGIVAYPKAPGLWPRWPRSFDLAETVTDYVDLLLLAACDYVVGSWGSSYSSLAIALNGSPRCRRLFTRWKLPIWF
jgi:hypothetical protein